MTNTATKKITVTVREHEAEMLAELVRRCNEIDKADPAHTTHGQLIRTPGPLIRSQLLYPLSYGRKVVADGSRAENVFLLPSDTPGPAATARSLYLVSEGGK